MSINLVVQSGTVKSLALKYDQQSRPELRWTLEQVEHATDGKPWTLWLPCCAAGTTAERLASALEDGQRVVITSGKLVYRKRQTKAGEQSRLEVLAWQVDVLSEMAQDDSTPGGPLSLEGSDEKIEPGGEERATAPKARRPRTPKLAQSVYHQN